MTADSVSIISIHDLSQSEEIKRSNEEDGIYTLPRENREANTDQNGPEIIDENNSIQSECRDDEEDSEQPIVVLNEHNHGKEVYSILKDMLHIIIVSIAIIAASIVCSIPWTTIPRTNSIIYQSRWMEILLPLASVWLLTAATDVMNLAVWTKEKSMMSMNVFLRMFLAYFIPVTLLYVSCYMIWCMYFGFYHPMPYLGLMGLLIWFTFQGELWIILPSDILEKEGFRRKLLWYFVYFTTTIGSTILMEIVSYVFVNFPSDLQFLLIFIFAACREFDFFLRSKCVDKMMGNQDESAATLLTVTVNGMYGLFIAIRLPGANLTTVCCVLAIDFLVHLKISHQVIKEHRKVAIEQTEQESTKMSIYTSQLVVSELMEGFVPIIYGAVMAMAYFGPNSNMFANIGSIYWGEKIEDIGSVFVTMAVLFAFDTMSVIVTSFFLWKATNLNLLQEICNVLDKYWLFFILKLGYSMSTYFANTDINFGMDTTGNFDWIIPEGRFHLIYNSSELTEEEKMVLLPNFTLT